MNRPPQALAAIAALALFSSLYAGQPAHATGQFAAHFLDIFDYKMDVDAKELFPTQEVKNDVLVALNSRQYSLAGIEREIAGFAIAASEVKIQVQPAKIDGTSTRLSVDIQGRDVRVGSDFLNKTYENLDVDAVYGIYNSVTDKVTIHVPFATALSLMVK